MKKACMLFLIGTLPFLAFKKISNSDVSCDIPLTLPGSPTFTTTATDRIDYTCTLPTATSCYINGMGIKEIVITYTNSVFDAANKASKAIQKLELTVKGANGYQRDLQPSAFKIDSFPASSGLKRYKVTISFDDDYNSYTYEPSDGSLEIVGYTFGTIITNTLESVVMHGY